MNERATMLALIAATLATRYGPEEITDSFGAKILGQAEKLLCMAEQHQKAAENDMAQQDIEAMKIAAKTRP
jgi:hypothetical protein